MANFTLPTPAATQDNANTNNFEAAQYWINVGTLQQQQDPVTGEVTEFFLSLDKGVPVTASEIAAGPKASTNPKMAQINTAKYAFLQHLISLVPNPGDVDYAGNNLQIRHVGAAAEASTEPTENPYMKFVF